MNNLPIYVAFKKIFPENYDADHYMETLFENPENTWFKPTNRDNESYSICEQMAAVNLIAIKRIPVWNNGSFCGISTEILYNKNLDYANRL